MQFYRTRQNSKLDTYFTINEHFVTSCDIVPVASDHNLVAVDSDAKPTYNKPMT